MDVFIARQPIFDRNENVVAYELLYRKGTENFYDSDDGDMATSTVVMNTLFSFGLRNLTEGKRAYINFTENLIKESLPSVFPKDTIVIEILEDALPDKELIEELKKLKEAGYIIALDDFVFGFKYRELLKLADIIKVDFLLNTKNQRRQIVKRWGNGKIKFLAEKVETYDEFQEAIEMGYSYFQGYFFSKPVVLSGNNIQNYKLNYIRILNELNRPEPSFSTLSEIIEHDLSLSYKLLTVAKSFNTIHEIVSIKHTLVMMGLKEVKRWVSIIMLYGINQDKPDMVLRNSLIRGRFGELLAIEVGLTYRKNEVFLMGMFSMVDALTNRPLKEVLRELPLSEDIKNALLGKKNKFRDIYNLIITYEKGDWDQLLMYTKILHINPSRIPSLFFESLNWSNDILSIN